MRVGHPFVHSIELVALAYELNTSGVSWILIHRYLGKGLRDAVSRAKVNGIQKECRS